jgi:hypothetical protein
LGVRGDGRGARRLLEDLQLCAGDPVVCDWCNVPLAADGSEQPQTVPTTTPTTTGPTTLPGTGVGTTAVTSDHTGWVLGILVLDGMIGATGPRTLMA